MIAWRNYQGKRRCFARWCRATSVVLISVMAVLGIAAFSIYWIEQREPADCPPGSVGQWVVSDHRPVTKGTSRPITKHIGGRWSFRFDGTTAYMIFFRMHAWEEGPEDSVYRLKTQWNGNDLYYLAPYGRWERLATFVDGRFQFEEDGFVWFLEKVSPIRLNKFDWSLAKRRPIWHYPALSERDRPIERTVEWPARHPGQTYTDRAEPIQVLGQDPDSLFQLQGHPDWINRLAYSPDGRRLASAGRSWDPDVAKYVGYVEIWDVASGKSEGVLAGLSAPILAVAFDPDGKRLALAGQDGSVSLWDSATRRRLLSPAAHPGPTYVVAFSHDGSLLASASEDKSVIISDTSTAKTRRVLPHQFKRIVKVAFASGDKRLLAASSDTVKVWELPTGVEERSFRIPKECLRAAFHPDGRRIAVGTWGTLGVWDIFTGTAQGRFSRHEANLGRVESIEYSPDGRYIASGGEKGSIVLWEAPTGRKLFAIRGYHGGIYGLAFSPDGRRLACCVHQEAIDVWDMASLLQKTAAGGIHGVEAGGNSLPGHTDWVWSIALTPEGTTLVSGSKDETIRLWDVVGRSVKAVLAGHIEEILCVSCSPVGRMLASGSQDGEIKLWELPKGKECASLRAHQTAVRALAFSPDGRTLASASYQGPVKLWDVLGRKVQGLLADRLGPVNALAFTPDGRILATGGCVADWKSSDGNHFYRPGEVILWNVETRTALARFGGYASAITCLALTADGKTLVAGCDDSTVRLYDIPSKERSTLIGHASPVRSVAVTADGRVAASGDWKGIIRLWDVTTGRELANFAGHSFWVNSLVFTPDGKTLISGSADKTVQFWDTEGLLAQKADRQ